MSMVTVDVTGGRAPSRILHDPLPGTGYRALRRIGGGSSSEVYEAVGHDRVRRAVKVLRSLFVDRPEAVLRLEQEGRSLAALDHPSLVPVLDVGTTATGRPFYVMPLLEGETARERLQRRGRIAPALATGVAIEMLEGLDAAHQGGVVHRDVKPANLFLPARRPPARTRRCVLMDFGVAKLLDAPGALTTDARVIGSPRYLAPEQILGGAVDARTDVYAAGITLFEMIAGRGPFEGDGDVDLMRAHLEAPPPSLRALAPVSQQLDHAIARAIAKAPARRWPTARVFAAVLERALLCELERLRAGLLAASGVAEIAARDVETVS
jgi:eukaryotic-like serine/threonine-protein kinase